MARILLKTTIPTMADDWHIGRFSLLAANLAGNGHAVTARDREEDGEGDIDLRAAAGGAYDQIWLFGVDVTGALTPADVAALDTFRARGGGLMLSRDHQNLGACLAKIGGIGTAQNFQDANPESDATRHCIDDTETPTITWPNYHSGRNGDAQRIELVGDPHPILRRADGSTLTWLPSHPHEGAVNAPPSLGHAARVIARGSSQRTGAAFNLTVAVEAGGPSGGGRAVADSSFHHFCDCNLDPAMGAPSFVTEPWGEAIVRDPLKRADADAYAANIAAWLAQ